ncbi:GNAT family N-acetyltransferase [Gracilibacillus salinarum]|uniref:GNAT family N-acetyltransferase n=1 Tax=Gracilibacillus salinarum TaxID=2932255 RepID=A0ABY4GNJ6_9BACI|nr:GNAT family N-acetyltransferase [Gracilibacillus salinarum]UOQ85756.1 GNAT family N-acetyltransferase [Gracilibacillus salinarum]
MSIKKWQYTDRVRSIIRLAEKERVLTRCQLLNPFHLLLGSVNERSGALAEVFLACDFNLDNLRTGSKLLDDISEKSSNDYELGVLITKEVERIFGKAVQYMKRYQQIFLNEGHLLKALITSGLVDNYLNEESRSIIVRNLSTPRDMITSLREYQFPDNHFKNIKRLTAKNYDHLYDFINENFAKDWLNTYQKAIKAGKTTIYIACNDDDKIIGFAAYDIVRTKKGLFGPMGVSKKNRTLGVGSSLLHHCLKDMKEIGYEYAIIGEAGPQEFYEKTCNARLIPFDY